MRRDISEYYRIKRKRDYIAKKRLHRFSIKWRRFIYPLMICLIKLDRMLSGEKCVVIHNKSRKQKNVIYACTHIGEICICVLLPKKKEKVVV